MTLRLPFSALGLCCLLGACSGLPQDVERPVSHALEAPADTPLGAAVAQRSAAAGAGNASGFLLLNGPADAYGSRLALTQAAQKTLDLQYYAIHADPDLLEIGKAKTVGATVLARGTGRRADSSVWRLTITGKPVASLFGEAVSRQTLRGHSLDF